MSIAHTKRAPNLASFGDTVAQTRRLLRRRPFLELLARRLLALVQLVLGITLIAFVLTHLVPGDPVRANLGIYGGSNPETVAAYSHNYGLDRPLPVQYGLYVWRLVHGDLGTSIQSGLPIRSELGRVIPATVELAIIAVSIGVAFGLALGTVAALYRNRWPDHILRVVSLAGISMPTFWIGLLALYLFFFVLNWVPGGGRLDPSVLPPPHETGLYTVDALLAGDWFALWNALHHLILPALVLAAFSVSVLTRFTRSAVLEVIEKDYVRAARAKGLSERNVVIGHVLRASFVSVLTVIGLVFANVLSGAILVEHIFGYPGLGQYAYQAAITLDLPAIMGVSMFVAGVYVTINFIVDVLYGVIDPRVRIG